MITYMDVIKIIGKVLNKCYREFYRATHPFLWGKRIQINGVPCITGSKNLSIGQYISINNKCYIQGSGGVKIGDRVTLSYGVTILSQGLDTIDYANNCKKSFVIM